jgi:putative transcriptional regulator
MKEDDFNNLIESIKQAGKIKRSEQKPSRVFSFSPADIKDIRSRLKLSQSEFAMLIGVSISTLQNWEQGRRQPEGPASALLKIASTRPETFIESLNR